MKIWQSIPVPPRLSRRPKDERGYPIPALVFIDDAGKPDFRITDHAKWLRACAQRTCALCGEPMGRHLAFVGGPLSHRNRVFTDLPMHKDCAEYALQVCPFLAAPRFRYAEEVALNSSATLVTSSHVSGDRPEFFVLGTTKDFVPMRLPDGTLVVQAAPWETVQWWKHGAPCEPPDIR